MYSGPEQARCPRSVVLTGVHHSHIHGVARRHRVQTHLSTLHMCERKQPHSHTYVCVCVCVYVVVFIWRANLTPLLFNSTRQESGVDAHK